MNRTVRQRPGEYTKEEREKLWGGAGGEHGVQVPHLAAVEFVRVAIIHY